MQKVLLYYTFVPLLEPDVVRLWQKTLCDSLGLKGRIIISPHGINGTVGGDVAHLKNYAKQTKAYEPFKKTVFKWTNGTDNDFPRMSVKVRDELVTFGAGDELVVDETGVVGGGTHLKPKQLHALLAERSDVVFFDGRSSYEAAVGKFRGAVVADVRTAKDFARELASGKYDELKNKPVVTYCTGGIRCEVLSTLMKNRGFQHVYQLDGGIVKYGQSYGDEGYWQGSLYMFDGRMNLRFSERSVDIGECIHCQAKTSNYENCALASCNNLVLICESCATKNETCSAACLKLFAATP